MTDSPKWRFYFSDRNVAASCLAQAVSISRNGSDGVSVSGYNPGIHDSKLKFIDDEPSEYEVLERSFVIGEHEISYPAYHLLKDNYEFGIWIDSELHSPLFDHWDGTRDNQACWLLGIETYAIDDAETCMIFADIGIYDRSIAMEVTQDKHLAPFYELLIENSDHVVKSAECIGDLLLIKHKNAILPKPIGLVDLAGYDKEDEEFLDDISDIDRLSDPIYAWLERQEVGGKTI